MDWWMIGLMGSGAGVGTRPASMVVFMVGFTWIDGAAAGQMRRRQERREAQSGERLPGERTRPGCCFCQAEVRPPSRKTRAHW